MIQASLHNHVSLTLHDREGHRHNAELLTLELAADQGLVADDVAIGSADEEGCWSFPSFCRCIAVLLSVTLPHLQLETSN